MKIIGYCFFVAAGNLIIFYARNLPDERLVMSVVVLLLPLLYIKYWRICYLLFFLSFAWSYYYSKAWEYNKNLISYDRPHVVVGVVTDLISSTDGSFSGKKSFKIKLKSVDGKATRWFMGYPLVAVNYPFDQYIVSGHKLTILATFKKISSKQNYGEQDFERIHFAQKLIAKAKVHVTYNIDHYPLFSGLIDRCRQNYSDYIQTLPSNKANGLLTAITNGDSRSIPKKQWESFTKSGTIHLVSISGSHLSLIAIIIYALIFRFLALYPFLNSRNYTKPVSVVLSAISVSFYSLFAGFSIPVVRALIMILLYLLVYSYKRFINLPSILFATLCIILLLIPTALLLSGTWLSLSAFSIIVLLSNRLQNIPIYLRLFYVQIILIVGLAPLLGLFFSSFTFLGSMSNIVAVPLVELVIMPLALFCFSWWTLFDTIPHYPYQVAVMVTHFFLHMLEMIPDSSWVYTVIPEITILEIFLIVFLSFLIFFPFDRMQYVRIVFGLGLFFIFINRSIHDTYGGQEGINVTLFEVGHGTAFLIYTKHQSLLYDTGSSFDDSSFAQKTILPYMKRKGIDYLDMVIISHGDNDHAGGLKFLSESRLADRYIVNDEYTKDTFLAEGVTSSYCYSYPKWSWSDTEFEFIHPSRMNSYRASNSDSCVLRITHHDTSILLMGDVGIPTEILLLDSHKNLSADILLAGHHGSATSTHKTFVTTADTKLVLVSSDGGGRFGLPSQIILSLLSGLNIDYMNTGWCGMITGKIDKHGYQFNCMRNKRNSIFNLPSYKPYGMKYQVKYKL